MFSRIRVSLRQQWAGIALGGLALLIVTGAPAAATQTVQRALFAVKAGDAKKVHGIKAAERPRPGKLLALRENKTFPVSVVPAGARGPRSVLIRFETFTSNSVGQSGHVSTKCDSGERAVGGGIGWTQSPGSGDAVTYSGPEDDSGDTFPAEDSVPTGWAGEIRTSDGAGKTGRIYAVCVSP